MKPIKKIVSIFSALVLMVFMAGGAFAEVNPVNLTLGSATVDISTNSTVSVDITVDDPSQIAGAAFTVLYDTEDLTLTGVSSTFFDTFANQGITQTSVTVDGETYTRPLAINDIPETGMMMGGTMIAAARVQAGETTNSTLFTLTFDLPGSFNGIYSIMIVPSTINNPAAGWNGEPSPMLVAAADPADPTIPLESAFPEIPVINISPDTPITASITITGSTNFDSVTLNINQPFNIDTEQYVDTAVGGEWQIWFHTDTNTLELNGPTIKAESIENFAAWAAGTLPDHTGVTATSLADGTFNTGDIFSIKISEEMYALVEVTEFVPGESLSFNILPLGAWNWAEGPGGNGEGPGEGCGGEFSISGTITDGSDNPVADIWIDVFSDTAMCGSRVMTDDTGEYTAAGLIAGDYKVSYWPPPPEEIMEGQIIYQTAFYSSTGTTSMWDEAELVSAETNPADINMVLNPGTTMSGMIGMYDTDGQTIIPINFPVWVEAWSESTDSWGGAVSVNGSYTIIGIAEADDYRVSIMPFWDWETGELMSPDFMQILYTSTGGTTNWDMAEFVPAPSSEINFLYKEGASISGRVTSDGFTGISGIWVNAWSETAMGNGAMTDANGDYTIKGLDDTTNYTVEVQDSNYAYLFIENVAPDSTDIDFIISTGVSITGTVTDDAANPISDVWVEAWSPSTGACGGGMSGENPDFTFNDTGDYTIGGLPPANDYIVTAWPCNYPSQEYSTAVNLTQGDAVDINFVLSAGKHIAGNVTDGTNPVVGVWIEAYSEITSSWGGAMTDENGYYIINGLPDAADYIVSYWPNSMAGVQYMQAFYNGASTWENATPVNINTASADAIDLILSAGVSISGTVTRGAIGIQAVWVDAWSETTNSWGGVHTDGMGGYHINGLASGSGYVVTVYPDNQVPVSIDTIAPATSIDFNLATATGKVIKGTVTDNTGAAIANVWVNVWSASTGSWGSIQTDDNGTFEISGLADASDFEVNIWSPEFGNMTLTGQTSGDGTGSGVINLDDLIFSTGVTISGTISGLTEIGWNLWADAWSESTESRGGTEAVFDSETSTYTYTINGLDESVIDYRVSVNGFNPLTGDNIMTIFYTSAGGTTMWDSAEPVDLSSGSVSDIDFAVDTGKSISGTVSIDDITAPNPQLEGIWVDAWSETSCSWGGGMTDSDGAYTLNGLASASDYRISVNKEGYPSVFYNETESTVIWDNATLVDVTATDAVDIDITLSKGGSITGAVTNTNGQAMADVWIDVYSPSQQFGMGVFTDTQGNYNLSGLIKGVFDYEVSVRPMGDYKPETRKGKKVGDVVNFTISQGFTFHGKLTVTGGSDYTGGASVNLWNEEFHGWTEVLSGSSTFSINGLSEGTYEIIIWPYGAGYVQIEDTLTDLTDASSSEASPMAFTFDAGLSITGTVTDSSEAGIPGVFVDAWSSTTNGGWGSAITGTDGTYTITGLPAGSDYVVSVWSPIYPGAEQNGISAGATDVDFTMSTGGSITGTVFYNGAPVENVWIEAYSDVNQSWSGASTGDDGTYTLAGLKEKTGGGVTITDYEVIAYPHNLAIQKKTGKKVGDAVDFNLTSGDSISGTILKSSDNDFSLEGVKVKFFNAGDANNGFWFNNVFTDENGNFEIKGLPAGNYNIKAQLEDYTSIWYKYSDGTDNVVTDRASADIVSSGTTDITFKLELAE